MTDLANNQWELGGLVFGQDCGIDIDPDAGGPGYSWRTQDGASAVGDATVFGRDRIEPDVWPFKLFTNVDDEVEALELRSQIAKVWRGDETRLTPGAVMALRYRLAGRTRVYYGRPRRFDAPLNNSMFTGYIPITCDFKLASELAFDDVEQNIPLRAVAPASGGFNVPFTWPLTFAQSLGPRPNTFTVDTDVATPGVFDFNGPVSDPFIEIDGEMRIQLDGEVPVGTTVTVDARPWVMSVYRSDGAGVAGMLNRRTRLPRLLLQPGTHVGTYGGYDPTGASSAAVRWRKAYPSV